MPRKPREPIQVTIVPAKVSEEETARIWREVMRILAATAAGDAELDPNQKPTESEG